MIERHSSQAQLAQLDFKWEDGVHDGRPAVDVDDLTCDEAGLLHAQERHGVADVFWGPEPAQRRPRALVPGSRGALAVLPRRTCNGRITPPRRAGASVGGNVQ